MNIHFRWQLRDEMADLLNNHWRWHALTILLLLAGEDGRAFPKRKTVFEVAGKSNKNAFAEALAFLESHEVFVRVPIDKRWAHERRLNPSALVLQYTGVYRLDDGSYRRLSPLKEDSLHLAAVGTLKTLGRTSLAEVVDTLYSLELRDLNEYEQKAKIVGHAEAMAWACNAVRKHVPQGHSNLEHKQGAVLNHVPQPSENAVRDSRPPMNRIKESKRKKDQAQVPKTARATMTNPEGACASNPMDEYDSFIDFIRAEALPGLYTRSSPSNGKRRG